MKRKTAYFFIGIIILLPFFAAKVHGQGSKRGEEIEKIVTLFSDALENVRTKYDVSNEEFEVFKRFDNNAIHLLKAGVLAEARKENFDPAMLSGTKKEAEKNLGLLYEQFRNTERLYPSSVDEYRHPHSVTAGNPCDSTGCNNIGFEDGNLSSWYGYYAENNSSTTNVIINNVTGGALGAVTEACNDPNVIFEMATLNAFGFTDTNLTTDYQISITSSGYDYAVPTVPRVSPAGGSHSVMLGDSQIVAQGVAILSKTFLVSSNNSNFTYEYAIFLNNPVHAVTQQPFFTVALLDENGDTIPNCGQYNVVSGYGIKGFDSTNFNGYAGVDKVYYRNWTVVNVPLKSYTGQCVTIVFEVADCALGGHFGYAYVDASCSPSTIISSSPNFCGQDSLALTAPPGAASYQWTGPTGGVLSGSTQQTVWIDSSGIYRVITTPVTGVACADTLYDTVGKLPGPPPVPSFSTTAACAGQPVHFINTSTDTASASFYWDFYNLGIYNDTNVVNPTWTYASPGTYTVKLQEINNGCGNDALITVKVDSTINGGFTISSTCQNTVVTMTNTTKGATTYLWNYGDPGSGANNSSSSINGSHTFTSAGTYTITLVATNGGHCPDTIQQTLILNSSNPTIRASQDSICLGDSVILTAGGGSIYNWSTGSTASSIIVHPTSTTTYTLNSVSGSCPGSSTITIYVTSAFSLSIAISEDTICQGNSTTISIIASRGGVAYKWSTGAVSSSISPSPNITTTYSVEVSSGPCFKDTSMTVYVKMKPSVTIVGSSIDTICYGQSVALDVTGANNGYSWTPPAGLSCTNCPNPVATPTTSTEYTVTGSDTDGCINSKNIVVLVEHAPVLGAISNLNVCSGDPATLTANQISGLYGTFIWEPGGATNASITVYPTITTTYSVQCTNRCGTDSASATVVVDPAPNPLFTAEIVKGCPPLCIPFRNMSSISSGSITQWLWLFGNGDTSHAEYPIYCYPSPGVFSVSLTAVSGNGCSATLTNDEMVTVFSRPTVNFTYSPQPVNIVDPTIQFINESTDAYGIVYWLWSFGDNSDSTSNLENPIHAYTDTGTFCPRLIAMNTKGCSDTVTNCLDVESVFTLYIPSAFSPNGDGLNDIFIPKGAYIKNFEMYIFDRWGIQIFHSTDINKGWHGIYNGTVCTEDSYVYMIKVIDSKNVIHNYTGTVTLIK